MTAKPIVPRTVALRDIDEAVAYYLAEAGEAPALRLIDAVEKTFARIGRHPTSGSPRYALELNLPGLRWVPVPCHPHLVETPAAPRTSGEAEVPFPSDT